MSDRRPRSRKQRAAPARRAEAQKSAPAQEPAARPRPEGEAAAAPPQGNQLLQKAMPPRGAATGGAPERTPGAEAAALPSAPASRSKPHRRPPSSADAAASATAEARASAGAEREAALGSQANGRTRAQGHRSIERIIVTDDAPDVEPGQMRKTDFLATLEVEVTEAAERELAPAGRSVGDCPWIPYWFAYYQHRDVAQIARAVVKFAPEAVGAATVGAAVEAVRSRVVRSVRQSLALGRPVDTPAGMPAGAFDPDAPAPPPAGPPTTDPILNRSEAEVAEGAVAGGARGGNESSSGAGGGARAGLGLGTGQPLDTATRGRMESAFGSDLSHVRVHSDARGQTAAGRENARAFAYGGDVAFAPGQHRPGTPIGDALLAHELAHTLQQGTGTRRAQLAPTGASPTLEADANRSALGAVGRLWSGTAIGVGTTVHGARPTLNSALHIARCGGEAPVLQADPSLQPQKTVDVQPHVLQGSERSFENDIDYANTRVFPQANVELNQLTAVSYSEATARSLIGADLEVEEGDPRSAEEQRLVTRFQSTTQVNVVYVHSFEGCSGPMGSAFKDRDPHGVINGMAVMTDDGSMTTLPHEIGHLMSLPHRNDGDALMTGSGTTDRTVGLNDAEIRKIRASNYAH